MSGELLPTLLQIFLTIKLGWFAGFFKIIGPKEARGLNLFVVKFALPVLVFTSLATLKFSDVKWSFLAGVFLAKCIIFVLVFFISYFSHSSQLSLAAIFSIFCTNTNDLGMGIPIVSSVFGPEHPYVGLLYLLTPVSMLILNPLGFIIMETDKATRDGAGQKSGVTEKLKTCFGVIRGLFLNPVVAMTVLGLVSNLVFSSSLPPLLLKFLSSLGSSFTSLAPFTLGLSMCGKLGSLRGSLLLPMAALLTYKTILTPFLTLYTVDKMSAWLEEETDPKMNNFAFLYGTFPTALGVSSYAGMYGVAPDLISGALIIVTVSSVPLMYVSANILDVLTFAHDSFLKCIDKFVFPLSIISFTGIILLTCIFMVRMRQLTFSHAITCILFLSGLEMSVSKILCHFSISHYTEAILYEHGLLTQNISAASLAVGLLLYVRPESSHLVLGRSARSRFLLSFLIFGSPLLASVIISLLFSIRPLEQADCYLAEDLLTTYVNVVIISVSISVVGFCIFFIYRASQPKSLDETNAIPPAACKKRSSEKEGVPNLQVFRHSLLLLLLLCSLLSSLSIATYRIYTGYHTNWAPRAVFKIFLFINQSLTTGSGLIYLAVFSIDCCSLLTQFRLLLRLISEKIKGAHDILVSSKVILHMSKMDAGPQVKTVTTEGD